MDQEGSQTPEASKPEPQVSPRHHLSLSWVMWVFTGIFFYVLSVGPVARITVTSDLPRTHPGVERVLETIYAPITAVANHWDPAEHILQRYLARIWGVPIEG